MKRSVAIVAALAVAGGAWAGGTYVVGGRVEERLRAQTAALTALVPTLTVVEQSHERGFLSSTRTTTYRLGCLPAATPGGRGGPITFTVRDRILHGPIPGGRAVGAAVVESELVLSQDAQGQLAKLFHDEQPVRARTVVGLGSAFRTEVTSPAAETTTEKGERIAWQGVRATASGTGGGEIEYAVEIPGLEITDARTGATLSLSGMRAHGRARPNEGTLWLATGTGEGEIATMEFRVPSPQGAPIAFALHDFRTTSDTSIANDLVELRGTMTGRATFADTRLENLQAKLSLRRIHAPTYARLMSRLMGASCEPGAAANPEAALAEMHDDLTELLAHGPEYALEQMSFELDGKRAELSYALGLDGVTAADAGVPLPVLVTAKGSLRADARFPAEWVGRLAGFGAGQAKQPAPTPEAMAQVVDGLVAQGFVTRDGDLLASSVRFANGALTVNGREIPLPQGRR